MPCNWRPLSNCTYLRFILFDKQYFTLLTANSIELLYIKLGITVIGDTMWMRKFGSPVSPASYRITKSMAKPNEAPSTTSIRKHGEEYQEIFKSTHPNWKSVPILMRTWVRRCNKRESYHHRQHQHQHLLHNFIIITTEKNQNTWTHFGCVAQFRSKSQNLCIRVNCVFKWFLSVQFSSIVEGKFWWWINRNTHPLAHINIIQFPFTFDSNWERKYTRSIQNQN